MDKVLRKIKEVGQLSPFIVGNKLFIKPGDKDKYVLNLIKLLDLELEIDEIQFIYDSLWLGLGISHQQDLNKHIHSIKHDAINISNLKTIDKYLPCNPSIVNYGLDYIINVRYVNYTQKYACEYNVLMEDGIVHTKNFLFWVNDKFEILGEIEISESNNRFKYYSTVQDLEDIRIFWNENGYLSGSCTICDAYPHTTRCIGSFITNFNITDKFPTENLSLDIKIHDSPLNFTVEKNWLPFVVDSKSCFQYWYNPLLQLSFDSEIVRGFQLPYSFNLRGSAGPLPYQNSWLILVHIHLWEIGVPKGRNYIHRFIEFDLNWSVKRISWWFQFQHSGIEFVPSMTWSSTKDYIYIGLGYEDCQAYIIKLSHIDLENYLTSPIPQWTCL